MAGSAEDFLDDLIERIAARVIERMPQPQAQPPQAAPAEYLTTKATAKLLGVGCSTLELWRAQRKHLAWTKIGTAIRYSRADIDAFNAKNTKRPK